MPAPDAATTLADEQRTLTAGVLRVQNLLRETPRDPSARAAAQAIRDRAADLNALANALGALSFHVRDARLAQLFENDAPLMEYLRGLYAWTKAVVRALEEAATGLRVLSPDWSAVRARIEDASSFYLADRERSIAEAATRLRVRQPDLDATIDEHLWQIFWAASYLFRSLEQKFG